jgi:hypothetical protein
MFKKIITGFLIMVILSIPLVACSGGTAAQTETTAQTTGTPVVPDASQMDANTMLLVGTLKLEGTDLAVTSGQAAELLPLWKAVKSLGSSDTTAQEEIDALYVQIKETMTAEQLAAIDAMTFTREDQSALMTQLGIENGFMGPGGGSTDPSARATQMAEFQSENPDVGNIRATIEAGGGDMGSIRSTMEASGGGFQGGGNDGGFTPPEGGMPGGGFQGGGNDGGFAPPEGGMPGGGFQGGGDFQGTPVAQGTPWAGQNRRAGMGMSQIFLDPLITLLEGRAAGS